MIIWKRESSFKIFFEAKQRLNSKAATAAAATTAAAAEAVTSTAAATKTNSASITMEKFKRWTCIYIEMSDGFIMYSKRIEQKSNRGKNMCAPNDVQRHRRKQTHSLLADRVILNRVHPESCYMYEISEVYSAIARSIYLSFYLSICIIYMLLYSFVYGRH